MRLCLKRTAGILFFLIITSVCQYIFKPDVGFLGQNTPKELGETLAYLLLTSTGLSILKIHCLPACFLAFWFLAFKNARTQAAKSSMLALCCVSYSSLLTYSCLKYPSLYAAYLSLHASKLIFLAAQTLPSLTPFIWITIISLFIGLCYIANSPLKRLYFATFATFGAIFIWKQTFSTLPTASTPPTALHNTQKPNILVLAVDSLRFDYFYQRQAMPKTWSFFQQKGAHHFLNHVVGIPRTFPSWVEFLYGQYGMSTHIRHMFPGFPERNHLAASLPSILKGYDYHISVYSDFAGDIFPRLPITWNKISAPTLTLKTMLQNGIMDAFPLYKPFILIPYIEDLLFSELKTNPSAADPMKLSREWKNDLANMKQPFFSIVFFSTAHFPYAPPWPYYTNTHISHYNGPFFFQRTPLLVEDRSHMSAIDIQRIRELYTHSLHSIDDAIHYILASMEDTRLIDNTIIILTADHGEDLFEDGVQIGHGEHLQGDSVLHVPMIIKLPSHQDHKEYIHITRPIDVAPTLLSLLNKSKYANFYGVNMMAVDTSEPKSAYSETGIWFTNKGESHFQTQRLHYPSISNMLAFDDSLSYEIFINKNFESTINTSKHRSLTTKDHKLVYMPTPTGPHYKLYKRSQAGEMEILDQNMLLKLKQELQDTVLIKDLAFKIIDDYIIPES